MRPRTQATTFQASWPWVYDVAKPDHIVELCGRDFHYSPYVLLTSVGMNQRVRHIGKLAVLDFQG